MSHLTEDQLSALADGALAGRERESCEAHLAACEACRARLDSLTALDRSLAGALEHDPGEAYFETFAERVAARIARETPGGVPAGRAAAPARHAGGGSRWAWLVSPRGLSLAGSAAALLVVAGLAWMRFQGRDDVSSLLAPREPSPPGAARPEAAAPPPAAPDDALRQQAAPEPVPAPAEVHVAPGPVARSLEQTRGDFRTREASPGTSGGTRAEEATPSRSASPGRAREVRRNEVGSDVPVKEARTAPTAQRPPAAAERDGVAPGEAPPAAMKRMATPFTTPPAAKLQAGEGSKSEREAPIAGAAESLAQSVEEKGIDSRSLFAYIQDAPGPCGVVRDPRGTPIAGARVTVTNDGLRTARSGPDGRFCLPRLVAGDTLSILRVGFEPVRLVVGPATSLAVRLEPIGTLGPEAGGALGRPGTTALDPGQRTAPGALVPAPVAPAADVYADQPSEVRLAVTQAREADMLARREGTALAYERSAEGWTRLAARVSGAAVHDARFHALASLRAAYRSEPTPARLDRLAAALAAFAASAPRTLPERATALRWQAELPKMGNRALYR